MKSFYAPLRFLAPILFFIGSALGAQAGSTTVVLSQVYGGGGNGSAVYTNDYIELHNISASPVSIGGWSVQYAAATGTTSWAATAIPAGTSLVAGGYFLVQEASGGAVGGALPPADATGTINLSATAGKVALVSNSTALNGQFATGTGTGIIDFVGYGTTANGFEGTRAPAPSNTTAIIRTGSTDTDNNANDFAVGTPNPHSASSTATQVSVETAVDGSGVSVPSQTVFVGSSLTAYSITRNASNLFLSNAAATWSLLSKTGGVVDGDLVPASDGKSAVFTSHAAGTAIIHVSSGSLSSVDSGVITASALPNNPMGVVSFSVPSATNGQTTLLTVSVTPGGNPPSTGITVTADLSAFGLSSTTQLYDDGTHGDLVAGDHIYSISVTIPAGQTGGLSSVPVSVSDAQGRSSTSTGNLNVQGNFTIFHTNDCHARITPHDWIVPAHGTQTDVFQKVGGAAYMGAKILALTAATPNSLVLDGGDISEGNPVGDYNNGPVGAAYPGNQGVVGFFQLLSQKLKAQPRGRGIDAWVVGNHDVRFAAYIANLKNQTDFPVISINVCNHGTKTPYFQPYVIVTVNGTKVGIIGYTTESSEVGPDLANTIDVVACDWSSSNSSFIHLSDTVNTLRNTMGCNVVILLTHDGHSDLSTQQSGKTNGPVLVDNSVAKLPEIAITGHWHTWCQTAWQPAILNYKTIFMESASFIKYVGELQVTGAGKYISATQYPLIDSQITPDPDIATYVQNEKNLYDSNTTGFTSDQILGYTADDLVLDKKMKWWSADEYPWDGDNSAGGFICDGLKWKAAQLNGGVCDLSIEVGGGVRSDIAAGPLTFTNIYETFPWDDDILYIVKMTGQEIWDFIQANDCDAGISNGWFVTAFDGKITSITVNGNPINLSATYNVSINNYIYEHNTFSDTNPVNTGYLCRQALMDYAQQFPQSSPYHANGPRYSLNTQFAGGYRAVVLMMNDNDSETVFDDGFIRMLSATPETLGRLGTLPVPTNLVNPDGTVNHSNRLSEIEWYRSYLGFKTGALKPGDIVEIYGKGGFFGGDPEFVDSEGIISDGVEFNIVGHDATLAQPEYYSSIAAFYNDTFKNHYVKFFAKKTGTNTVVDSNNTTLSIMDVTAYNAKTLPGNVGDLLQITGTTTDENYALRFRCDSAVLASSVGVNGFPPSSQVTAIASGGQTAPITLTASASVAPVNSVNTVSLVPIADAQVTQGSPSANYGTSTNLYIQSAVGGSYQNERAWLKFDLSSLPAGSNITGARLKIFCWKATGASLPTAAYGSSTDSWTETGITWNNQPGVGSALSNVTLTSGATNVTYSWDVTGFVQSEFGGDKTASLLVKAVTEGSTDATSPAYGFDSKEYGSNSPVLEVDTPSTLSAPTVAQVQYYYRYSADGVTYGAWTAYQTATTPPYSVIFNYPSGAGYYEFYSVATDSNGVTEPYPALYDTSTTYNISQPDMTGTQDTPTLPQWAMILLGVTVVGFAAYRLRTKPYIALFMIIGIALVVFLITTTAPARISPKIALTSSRHL